jgi:hypothetical protein
LCITPRKSGSGVDMLTATAPGAVAGATPAAGALAAGPLGVLDMLHPARTAAMTRPKTLAHGVVMVETPHG